jgi:prevent-host-death family protein
VEVGESQGVSRGGSLDRETAGCYIGGYMRPSGQVSVRDLKNQTTTILRRVEAGERLAVTKRGHVIATLAPAAAAPLPASDSIYRRLQRQIEARTPRLRGLSDAMKQAMFERISRKIARTIPYKTWRDMDRAVKGVGQPCR